MRSFIPVVVLVSSLVACTEPEPEDSLGVASSELVTNPTLGGPWGSLATCSTKPLVVGPNGAVSGEVVLLLDNAAANWGHTNAIATHAASSTGSDGLGASKWYKGSGGNAKALVAYWNNATQCAYVVANTGTSCLGTGCTAQSNNTSAQLYDKYRTLSREDGVLGLPISNPVQFGSTSVTYQLFTNGVITYHASHGAHYAGGPADDERALARAWMRAFGVTPTAGPPGYPLMEDAQCTNTLAAPGNCTRDAGKNGRYVKVYDPTAHLTGYLLARSGWTEGYAVWGRFAATWMSVSGNQPWNVDGFPLGDAKTAPSGEQYVLLERGALFSATTPSQAVLVAGQMYTYWTDGRADRLGVPTGPLVNLGDGALSQSFRNGNVYRTPRGTVYTVEGGPQNPTLAAYLAAGGPHGPWGYPSEEPFVTTSTYRTIRPQRFGGGRYLITGDTTGEWVPDIKPGLSYALSAAPLVVDSMVVLDSIVLTWFNTPGTVVSRKLFRQIDGGPWVEIRSLAVGDTASSDNATTAALGGYPVVPRDRNVCYQVKVDHVSGNDTATNIACLYTPSGLPRQQTVNRLTVLIRTSTKSDAQTQHRVRVLLQAPETDYAARAPRGNATWVETPYLNFTRGSTGIFELSTDHIDDLADLTQLAIDVVGDDALCVAGVDLRADNALVFSKEYGDQNCAWTELVGKPGGRRVMVATYDELHAHPAWQAYNTVTGLVPPVIANFNSTDFRYVGFTKQDFIAKLDANLGNQLAEEASDPQGQPFYPRFLGTPTSTASAGTTGRRLRVIQHVHAKDDYVEGDIRCELDFQLLIAPGSADGSDPNGTHIEIPPSTSSSHCENYQGASILGGFLLVMLPGLLADQKFEGELNDMKFINVGTAPTLTHYCFGGPGGAASTPVFRGANGGMDDQSFTLCGGALPITP